MCGIIGGIGNNIFDDIKQGLYRLEYRGYDSVGISYIFDNKIVVKKRSGNVNDFFNHYSQSVNCNLIIGHTRWATTGIVNDANAHPHLSFNSIFSIVHNGIIENYEEIKNELISEGYHFKSDTDSEVIVNLIEKFYLDGDKNVLDCLKKVSSRLIGNFSIALIDVNEPDYLYFYKRKSPLLVGIGKNKHYIASDIYAISTFCEKFIDIGDDNYGFITSNKTFIFDKSGLKKINYYKQNFENINNDLCGYEHFMLKEIEEIPNVIQTIIDEYTKENYRFNTNDLLNKISEFDCIIFIGCGSSYNAGKILSRLTDCLDKPSFVFIASEWSNYPKSYGKNPIFVILSQSGETMDDIKCIDIINKKGYSTILLTNNEYSTLAKKSTYVLPIYSKNEVAVASTKTYVAMIAVYLLFIFAITKDKTILSNLRSAIEAINDIILRKNEIKNIAHKIKNLQSVVFLGRGYDYDICLEASLKLKETAYINSQAIPSGELKHGPIAFVDNNVAIFTFFSDVNTFSATLNNVEEVKIRGGNIYNITNKSLKTPNDSFVCMDTDLRVCALVKSVFAFYLAYYTAEYKKLPIDKPRNLAKSVTVD